MAINPRQANAMMHRNLSESAKLAAALSQFDRANPTASRNVRDLFITAFSNNSGGWLTDEQRYQHAIWETFGR